MTRRGALAGGLLLAAAVGLAAGGTWVVSRQLAGTPAAPATTTASVRTVEIVRKTLQVQASLTGTLGFDGSIDIRGALAGTLTATPAPGTEIDRGFPLYEIDGRRSVVLFYGTRPAWRSLSLGVANGADIEQLERNLQALGYTPAGMAIDGHWDRTTTKVVKRWQASMGLPVDGTVDLGEVVFLPGPFRVTSAAALGTTTAGLVVLHGTTTRRVISLALPATRRSLVTLGQPVTVLLPDGSTTKAHVGSIGRVAHTSDSGSSGIGSSSTPTIDVTVELDDPAVAPDLDQAPVSVRIVTSSRANVLAVPTNALVALAEGGYAVEVVGTDGSRRYAGVTLGLFDSGWVELSGGDVREGDRVVVPS